MQKARRSSYEVRQLVDIRFQVLFHSPPGVLFTFPSRYLFTIGHVRVFSLTTWSWQIQTEFHVVRPTWEINSMRYIIFGYGTITLYGLNFPEQILLIIYFWLIEKTAIFSNLYPLHHLAKLTGMTLKWFRLFPFRSPLLRESLLFSFPEGTEMFHFPSLSPFSLYIQLKVPRHYSR